MFDEDIDAESTPATMFPFLSVLFCTIGALVVIMVIGSMLATVKGEDYEVDLADVMSRNAHLANLQESVANVERSISEITSAREDYIALSDEASSMTDELEEENVDLAGLEAKNSDNMQFVEKADLALIRKARHATRETTLKKWTASKTEVDRARTERSKLSKQIETARSKIDVLKAKAAQPIPRYRFARDPEGREPVLIELKADGVVVHSDGAPLPKYTKVPKNEALAKSGFLDKLAASLTRPGAKRYAVLFVRPKAVDLFFVAADRLRRRRAPHTAEPVEGNWRLEFEIGDATPN